MSIYAVNGLLKYRSDLWLSGTAVPRIFHLEEYIVGLGPLLADSPALLTAVNWLWIGLLSVSVGLVVWTDRLRIALAAAFVVAQLGIAATMRLGVFPFVMVAGLLLFFPPRVWDRLEAVVELGSRSKPSLAGDPPTTTTDETAGASAVSTAIPARVRRSRRLLRSAVLACLLVTSLLWQASGVGLVESPAAERDGELSDVHWSFFAPNPPDATRWYRVDATFESNEPTDGDGGSASVDRPPDAADAYSSTLWMRYGSEIGYADERYYEPLAAYHCERLGRGVESVTIRHVEQPVGPDGPVEAPTSRERISRTCRPVTDDRRPDLFRRRPN